MGAGDGAAAPDDAPAGAIARDGAAPESGSPGPGDGVGGWGRGAPEYVGVFGGVEGRDRGAFDEPGPLDCAGRGFEGDWGARTPEAGVPPEASGREERTVGDGGLMGGAGERAGAAVFVPLRAGGVTGPTNAPESASESSC